MALNQQDGHMKNIVDKPESDGLLTEETTDEFPQNGNGNGKHQEYLEDTQTHKEQHCGNGTDNGNGVVKKYDRSESTKKTTQSLFELVYEIIEEREQRTKEMGTLIRKYQ